MKVLVVDDEKSEYIILREYFKSHNITNVDFRTSPISALEALKSGHYDLALIDFNLTLINAEQLIIWLKDIRPNLNTDVYVTSNSDIESLKEQLSKYNGWFKGCLSKIGLEEKLDKVIKQYINTQGKN